MLSDWGYGLQDFGSFPDDEPGPVKHCYENGECPDCGESIPEEATDGDECKNCGHIFWSNPDAAGG